VGVRVIVGVDVWVGVKLGVGGIVVAVFDRVTFATGLFKLQADRIKITLKRKTGLAFITLLPFTT